MPRSRFLPVKKTSDLLLVMSNLYVNRLLIYLSILSFYLYSCYLSFVFERLFFPYLSYSIIHQNDIIRYLHTRLMCTSNLSLQIQPEEWKFGYESTARLPFDATYQIGRQSLCQSQYRYIAQYQSFSLPSNLFKEEKIDLSIMSLLE